MSEVLFVGTSDAFGAGGRRQSAVFVRGSRGALLLDCGVTTNTGLEAEGIQRDEIDAIVVSHFHGDHFGGIPLLLLGALYEDRRTRPLHIAGPPDIEARVHALADAMGHGIRERDWSFEIRFSEVPPGTTHQLGPAEHLIPVDEFAEFELAGSTTMTREEFRTLCDRCKTKEEILEALSGGQ
jgi:ribonuclease BN (tRNA processing enzyme)